MNIKEERNKRGWTQKEMAKKLGVTSLTIINYEKNPKSIPESKLSLIAEVLGINDDLVLQDSYLVKNGLKISLKELAVLIVEHKELLFEENILRLTIDKMVAEKVRDVLKRIIEEQDSKKK